MMFASWYFLSAASSSSVSGVFFGLISEVSTRLGQCAKKRTTQGTTRSVGRPIAATIHLLHGLDSMRSKLCSAHLPDCCKFDLVSFPDMVGGLSGFCSAGVIIRYDCATEACWHGCGGAA